MKRRGLQSPDIADALALIYARTVFPRETLDWLGNANNVVTEYNPFSEAAMVDKPYPEATQRYYAPGWPRLKEDDEVPRFHEGTE